MNRTRTVVSVSESDVKTAVMAAIELEVDVAYHDRGLRHLAVAAEAWNLAGYFIGAIDVSHGGGADAILAKITEAKKHRDRKILHADARGMLRAFTTLAEVGLLTYSSCAEARRQRWIARGGHDFSRALAEAAT
jgi:hypothetical protein